jgi:surface polysaccharide O-acyltransferase-like enzyme
LHSLWYAAISVAVTGLAIYLVIQGVFSGLRLDALWYFKNQSPTTQIAAIACFLAFANWDTEKISSSLKNIIGRVAAQSFFIYLIHAGILHFVLDGLNRLKWYPAPILFIPLGTLLIFVLSFYLGEGLDVYKERMKKQHNH